VFAVEFLSQAPERFLDWFACFEFDFGHVKKGRS